MPSPANHPRTFIQSTGSWRWWRERLYALPRWGRWLVLAVLLSGSLALLGIGLVWMVYSSLARGFDLSKLGQMPERSVVLDARERVIGRLHGENRVVVPLSSVSPHFIQALLAREDDRFYKHSGIDLFGIGRALVRNVKDRDFTQGASTLTMQLARSSLELGGKTLHRKLLEMAIARRIESELNKDQILELYVNRIFFGTGIYGVERASQLYFGKPARDLKLDEAAMLAAIIRGPNKFSPFRNHDVATSGRNMVLDRMVLKNRLDPDQAGQAKRVVTRVQNPPDGLAQESYALDAVRRDLDRVLNTEDEDDGGLRIHTTLDLHLQKAAEEALEARLSDVEKTKGYQHPTRSSYLKLLEGANPPAQPDYLQGAVIVFQNETGAVLTVVGGRDFHESSFNRALSATRQVGSTFKPFVYTAAIQSGLFPTTLVDDGPVEINGWAPQNSDSAFRGPLPAEAGLYKSRNTMTVRVGEFAGLDRVAELAARAGMGTVEQPTPQLYIGNLGATLSAVTSAYSAFPMAGVRSRPHVISHIQNRDGEVIFRNEVQTVPVLSPGASWCVTRMLQKVLSPSGTGAYARTLGFKSKAAGKTGTTDDFKDAWFIGYNKQLTCGVWVGMDQPERITYQGYGSRMALPIWVDVMKASEKLGYKGGDPTPDVPTSKVEVCQISGQVAGGGCRGSGSAVITELPVDLLERFATTACADHGGGPFGWRAETRPAKPRSRRSVLDRIFSIFR
ncbi:MAG: transglycosylase domain-containing protein [Verrucomicrobiales bacterium]